MRINPLKEVDNKYTYEEAFKLVLDALNPLGEDYLNGLKELKANKKIDVIKSKAKTTIAIIQIYRRDFCCNSFFLYGKCFLSTDAEAVIDRLYNEWYSLSCILQHALCYCRLVWIQLRVFAAVLGTHNQCLTPP